MITPNTPIKTPINLIKFSRSKGKKNDAKSIPIKDVFAFKIDAKPPVVVC